MFGNADRLDVVAAVAADATGTVNATDLQWQLGIANNRVRAQLLALAEAGLLRPEAIEGARGRRFFTRTDDPFWDTCLEWYDAWSR